MFPRTADEARYIEHEMVIHRSVGDAGKRLRQNPDARVEALLSGGCVVSGSWIECNRRGVSVHDEVDGTVRTTDMALGDVMAVTVIEATEDSPLIPRSGIDDALTDAIVKAAHFHDGRTVNTALERAGEGELLRNDALFGDLHPDDRRRIAHQLLPTCRHRDPDLLSRSVAGALEILARDLRGRGVDETRIQDGQKPFLDGAISEVRELPEEDRRRLDENVGRVLLGQKIDGLPPFVRRDELEAMAARYVQPV